MGKRNKSRHIVKIGLDIVMAVLFVLMFNKNIWGMAFHEIGGLIVCAFFIIHKLLNWNWIKGVSQKLLSKGLPVKTRIGYMVDVLLLLTMGFVLISGIFISKVVFTGLQSSIIWKVGHPVVAAFGLMLIGVHVGLHWSFVMGMFKRIKGVKIPAKVAKPVVVLLLVALFAFGGYSMGTSSFVKWIAAPFSTASVGHAKQGEGLQGGSQRPTNGRQRPEGANSENEKMNHSARTKTDIGTVASVLSTYLSILAVFAMLSYYIDKRFRQKKLNMGT